MAKKEIKNEEKKPIVKRKAKRNSSDITKIYAPKRDEESTVSEELRKVTSSMSKEQVKKPRRIAFMVCFYVTICLAIFVFCLIKLSKPKIVDTSENKYKEMYEELYKEIYETSELLYDTQIESEIENDVEINIPIEETTEKESTRNIEELLRALDTSRKKETTKPISTNKELEATKETINRAILNRVVSESKTNKQANQPAISRVLPKYDKELYSFATFYQYSKEDLQQAYNQMSMYYDKIKDLVFGTGIDINDKGINGIIYLNYTNMKSFMTAINDAIRAKYIALVDVQTSDQPLTFDFKNARDMDLYYEIPASDGKKRFSLMVLKKSKVGFSQDYNLTSSLEILDIECNTKHNPYFDIEDVVGENPKIKGKFKEQAYNIDDMLYTTMFNRVSYDKKGYITDIFYMQ